MVFSRNDIIAKNFSKVPGGYDAEEVDSFLDALADDLARRDRAIAQEREKSAELAARLRQMQEQLKQEVSVQEQNAEADAEARELIEQARLQAKMVLDRAKEEAQTIVREAKEQGELIVTRKKQETEGAPRLRPLAQRMYSSFIGIDPRFTAEEAREETAQPEGSAGVGPQRGQSFAKHLAAALPQEAPALAQREVEPVPQETPKPAVQPEIMQPQPEKPEEPRTFEQLAPQQSGESLNPFIFEETVQRAVQPVPAAEKPATESFDRSGRPEGESSATYRWGEETEKPLKQPSGAAAYGNEIWREEELEEGMYPQTDWLNDPEQRYESQRPWQEGSEL